MSSLKKYIYHPVTKALLAAIFAVLVEVFTPGKRRRRRSK